MLIHHLTTTDSTNRHALRLWRERGGDAPAAPLLVSADVQSDGVGRDGRPWQSPAGGLWMSLAWPLTLEPAACAPLPLVVGLAVAETLEARFHLAPRIKWPNDILVGGRKLAGILCRLETVDRPPLAVIGVGLNANLRATDLGPGLRTPAASLLDELGREVDLPALREAIADRLVERLRTFESAGFVALHPLIEARLAWRGDRVAIEQPGGRRRTGTLRGIDDSGALVLCDQAGALAVSVGDVTHVSAPDA